MAPQILTKKIDGRPFPRQLKTPKARHPSDDSEVIVSYFPGEAARILGLRSHDYRQLRRLFAAVAGEPRIKADRGSKKWAWSRYEFQDLVALRVALRLARRTPSGRLELKAIQEACAVLRTRFSVTSPLTEIRLQRQGDSILARVDGRVFDARTGQRLIEQVATHVSRHVQSSDPIEMQACEEQIDEQSRALRRRFSHTSVLAVVTPARRAR
jgi:hypothetical protein